MDINVSLNKLKVVNSVVRQSSFEKIEFDSRKVGAGDMFVASELLPMVTISLKRQLPVVQR